MCVSSSGEQFGSPTEWLIRTPVATDAEIQQTSQLTREAIISDFRDSNPEMVRLERVGPAVGAILQKKAWTRDLTAPGQRPQRAFTDRQGLGGVHRLQQ